MMQNVTTASPQIHAALSHSFPQRADQFIQADPSAFDQARYHPHIRQYGGIHHTCFVQNQTLQLQLYARFARAC
jgi:hypothetical protein